MTKTRDGRSESINRFLLRVLNEDVIKLGEFEAHLRTPSDWLRRYLAGDVLPTMNDFFAQPEGRFHAALFELEDEELVKLLSDSAPRLDLILSAPPRNRAPGVGQAACKFVDWGAAWD